MMGVSRSGYYKWKKRGPSETDEHRQYMIELVRSTHEKHRTHGYRWTAAYIRINEKVNISDGYAYKCFRFLGIKAETLHRVKYRPRKERDKYPNLVYSTWETVDRPRQVIVSDMTMIKGPFFLFEVTFYFDVFTKEMLTFQVGLRRGDRTQYIEGLIDIIKILRFQGFETEEPTILHTDQGSVYSSLAYNDLIKDERVDEMMQAVLNGNESVFFETTAVEDIFTAEMVKENFIKQALEMENMQDVEYFKGIINSLIFKALKKMKDY